MEETGTQDSETVRHQGISEGEETVHHSACRRNGGEGKLSSATSQRQAMIADATHRGHRPPTSNRSPPTGHLDDGSGLSGTPLEQQSDRLRVTGTSEERGDEVVARREVAGPLHGLSEGLLGPFGITKGPTHPVHGPVTNNFQSEGAPLKVRATKSPVSPAPTSRVTAFSVADILDPGKFGGERRDRGAEARLSEAPRLRSGAGPHHELWSPWMQRLEMQLRAGAASINNINFLRGIGQSLHTVLWSIVREYVFNVF